MGKMEKFGVKYTSICYEKWGTHALFCSRHSHNFSKDETTLYIARATITMPFKVRFLASAITIEILLCLDLSCCHKVQSEMNQTKVSPNMACVVLLKAQPQFFKR